eukprot:SAG31_NODE_1928_length_6883_cov_6.045106_8_plen_160_part_00
MAALPSARRLGLSQPSVPSSRHPLRAKSRHDVHLPTLNLEAIQESGWIRIYFHLSWHKEDSSWTRRHWSGTSALQYAAWLWSSCLATTEVTIICFWFMLENAFRVDDQPQNQFTHIVLPSMQWSYAGKHLCLFVDSSRTWWLCLCRPQKRARQRAARTN